MSKSRCSLSIGGRLTVGALALAVAGTASPCGFEDPNSAAAQRGMMNLAFPKSAYVRTAIWQAQMAGELPPDTLAQRTDLSSQGRGTLQLVQATSLLKALAARLGVAKDSAEHPSIAIVLMGPMLWSRLESSTGRVAAQVHVTGPESSDVVLVTDTPAIAAIVQTGMSFGQAIELGLMRFYGPPAQVDALQAWLKSS